MITWPCRNSKENTVISSIYISTVIWTPKWATRQVGHYKTYWQDIIKLTVPEICFQMWTFILSPHLHIQVYQLNTGHYLCRNKYYGRGLSIEGFRQALHQYLHNGNGLRQDLFEPILNKLRSLKAVLERQASYRFYSSSLLIIYEGQVSQEVSIFNENS